MPIVHLPWSANGIADRWADGVRTWELHRSTDWDGQTGTFVWLKDVSAVEGQEEYTTTDNDGATTYAYKVRGRTTGGAYTFFSGLLEVGTAAAEIIQAQKVYGRYRHPSDLWGTWRDWHPQSVCITAAGLLHGGNQPYVAGTDWDFELALLYEDSDEVIEGIDLSGATEILIEILDSAGAVAGTRELTEGPTEIEVLSQATKHSEGGYMGHFVMRYASDETTLLDKGSYKIRCTVSWTLEVVRQFEGSFEVR